MTDTLLFIHEAIRNAGIFAFVYCFVVFITGGVCSTTHVQEDEPEPVGQGTGNWEAT